jgi:hypothetical protein
MECPERAADSEAPFLLGQMVQTILGSEVQCELELYATPITRLSAETQVRLSLMLVDSLLRIPRAYLCCKPRSTCLLLDMQTYQCTRTPASRTTSGVEAEPSPSFATKSSPLPAPEASSD